MSAAVSASRGAKVAVQCDGRTLRREFPAAAAVDELQQWIDSEFGPGMRAFVPKRRAFLDAIGSATLADAGLCPSAFLQLIPGAQSWAEEEELQPALLGDEDESSDSGQRCDWRRLLAIFAPFGDVPEREDLFQVKN